LERFTIPPTVKVALELPADLPMVFADPPQVEQVLGNLTLNACQALATQKSSATGVATQKSSATGVVSHTGSLLLKSPSNISDRGKVTISARLEKDMVAIAVKDTGTGITPENMPKLFEPLFTTKAKGIGLGLAVSRKLAEANGGRIEVQSELGKGSTFTLVLPVVT
jgi:signal transduction histidine kinase